LEKYILSHDIKVVVHAAVHSALVTSREIGFNYESVAPRAKKVMVNIDKNELTKPTLNVDVPINADASEFILRLDKACKKAKFAFNPLWLKTIQKWKLDYPSVTLNFYHDKKHVNTYVFFEKLSDYLKANDCLVTGIGLDAVGMYQAFRVKKGQRAFVNKNFGPMGWGLPAAIGACVARNHKSTVLVTGDGSLVLNLQELASVDAYRLPIKIFIFNNDSYESIRSTQDRFFELQIIYK